jgi:hypothetical protein
MLRAVARLLDPQRIAATLAASVTISVARVCLARAVVLGSEGLALCVYTALLEGPLYLLTYALERFARARGPFVRLGALALVAGASLPGERLGRVALAVAVVITAWSASNAVARGDGGPFERLLHGALAAALVACCSLPWLVSRLWPSSLRVAPRGTQRPSLLVVGTDGADWGILRDLSAQGGLPHFSRLMREGVSGPLLTLRPTSSPFLWNSIYTGFSPAAHRMRPVAGAFSRALLIAEPPPGRMPDPLSVLRRLSGAAELRWPLAFWDVLAGTGYDTAVIGAWESEPVPERGLVFASTAFEYHPADPSDRGLLPSRAIWLAPRLRAAAASLDRPPARIPGAEWSALFGSVPSALADATDAADLRSAGGQ